jgi:hypothetical protein
MNATTRVCTVLSHGEWLAPHEIARRAHISLRTVSRIVPHLPGIEHDGKTRATRYRLCTTGGAHVSEDQNGETLLSRMLGSSETQKPQYLIPDGKINELTQDCSFHDSGHDSGHVLNDPTGIKNGKYEKTTGPHNQNGKERHSRYSPRTPLRNHPGAWNLADLKKKYFLEIDKIQLLLFDEELRNLILQTAQEKGWPVNEGKRQILVYPMGKNSSLTFQLGISGSTIVLYSKEPGDLKWVGEWVCRTFPSHSRLDIVRNEFISPKNKKGFELTLVVVRPRLVATLELVLLKYYTGSNTLYIKSPNTITPGFKAYPKKDYFRIELVGNNDYQVNSSFPMMQEFAEAIEDEKCINTEINEFLKRYYARFVTAHCDKGPDETIGRRERKQGQDSARSGDNQRKLKLLIDRWKSSGYHALDVYYKLKDVAPSFSEILGVSPFDATIFLAASMALKNNNYQSRITRKQITDFLRGHPQSDSEIDLAKKNLIDKGLLEEHDDLDFRISPFGIACFKQTVLSDE